MQKVLYFVQHKFSISFFYFFALSLSLFSFFAIFSPSSFRFASVHFRCSAKWWANSLVACSLRVSCKSVECASPAAQKPSTSMWKHAAQRSCVVVVVAKHVSDEILVKLLPCYLFTCAHPASTHNNAFSEKLLKHIINNSFAAPRLAWISKHFHLLSNKFFSLWPSVCASRFTFVHSHVTMKTHDVMHAQCGTREPRPGRKQRAEKNPFKYSNSLLMLCARGARHSTADTMRYLYENWNGLSQKHSDNTSLNKVQTRAVLHRSSVHEVCTRHTQRTNQISGGKHIFMHRYPAKCAYAASLCTAKTVRNILHPQSPRHILHIQWQANYGHRVQVWVVGRSVGFLREDATACRTLTGSLFIYIFRSHQRRVLQLSTNKVAFSC